MKRTRSYTTIIAPASKKQKKSTKTAVAKVGFPIKNGVPNTMRTTLKYVGTRSITPPASGVYSHVFSANGCYDPDITGTGHQPMGFDQMMSVYKNYHVVASRISIMPILTSATSISPGIYSIQLNNSSSAKTAAALYEVLEQRYVSDYQYFGSLASEAKKVKYSADIGKWFNCTPTGEDHLGGTAGANPQDQCYFHVCWGQSFYQAGTMQFVVHIEYDTVFSDPWEQVSS